MRNRIVRKLAATGLATAAVLGLAMSTGSAHAAGVINVDFNTAATDFTSNFATAGGGAPNFAWSATGGINDNVGNPGGGVTAPAAVDQTALYKNVVVPLNDGQTYTISQFVKETTVTGNSGDKYLQLGFSNSVANSFNSDAGKQFLTARILGNNQVEFQFRNASATAQQNTTSPIGTVTSGDWVKLVFSLTAADTTTGKYNYTFSASDYGPTGTVINPTVIVAPVSGTVTDAAYIGAATSNWVAGFRTTLADNFDGLVVTSTPTPEPGTISLIAFGAMSLLARRRR